MNWLIFLSGLVALFTTFGHFAMGSRLYLKPMMRSDLDEIARNVMRSVFHYVSVFLVFSAVSLLMIGYGVELPFDAELLVLFIAINYAGFAVTEILIALTSTMEKSLFKMFHWVFFTIIAALAWLGIS